MSVTLLSLRFGRARGKMPPLGALSLASALDARGIDVDVIDTQFDPDVNPFSVEALQRVIGRTTSGILAFSIFHDAVPLLAATLNALGPALAHRRVIVGGPGVVGIQRRLLEAVPAIEMVVVGEGETALPLAVSDPVAARALPGVFWRDGDRIHGAGRTPREDLDAIAPVHWDWCRGRGYSSVPWSTMRGCPFDCEFCEIIAFMGRRVTARDIPSAVDDLERAMACLGVRQVDILDDTFTINKKRVLALCREITRRRLDIRFSIFSRTDTLDEPTMEVLAEAGCERVFFGMDGADDEVLRQINKRTTVEAAAAAVRDAARYFNVTASFIWGYPFESWNAFERLLDLMGNLRAGSSRFAVWPQLHLLSPSAGTPLFDKFGHTLTLDLDHEVLPIGRKVSSESFRRGYDETSHIIRTDPVLAAAFWHYATPRYAEKCAAADAYNRGIDIELGQVLSRELALLEGNDGNTGISTGLQ